MSHREREYFPKRHHPSRLQVCQAPTPQLCERVAMILDPWLSEQEKESYASVLRDMNIEFDFQYGDTTLVPPWPPRQRRMRGSGKDSVNLSAATNAKLPTQQEQDEAVSPYVMIHFAWDWLGTNDRKKLAEQLEVSPAIKAYAKLRKVACRTSVAELRRPRPPANDSKIDDRRVHLMAIALIKFDFCYADLIRYLGGEYTNEQRDWQATLDLIRHVQNMEPPPGYPKPDFERAEKLVTQGVPLVGHYVSSYKHTAQRNLYHNHDGLQLPEPAKRFEEQLRIEEQKSYHNLLPRWLWRFLPGLCISPINFLAPKYSGDLGRIAVDPTTKLSPDDTGAANDQIPAPGTEGRTDENPRVFYGTALM
jgi:hypothetical protein